MIYALCFILSVVCGIFWRMGGSQYFNKLWRRVGSTLCILAVLALNGYFGWNWQTLVASVLIGVGCSSYFGWLTPNTDEETWINFLAEGLFIQCPILFFGYDFYTLMLAIGFALIGSMGKSKLDHDGKYKRPDIIGEIFYGFFMCLGVSINALI